MSKGAIRELARIGVLAAAAAWLLHPFATGRLYGAGDALWYANMLADYVTQLRQGIFPIFIGQTEFAFNGAVYPLRAAPMYQHMAGALDLITGHSLGFFALQHLVVIVCGVTGIFVCYLSLCRIAPDKRWCAVAFSILYLSCPGLLATIYTQDLYMTWMTVPFAPLAAYGIMRTYRNDDLKSQLFLAAPLAALWWAHAPIALWFTVIASASQIVRLVAINRGWPPLKRSILGAGLFCLLAQYPFISVAEVQAPGKNSEAAKALPHPELITQNIRGVFPAIVEPLSDHARSLGDLQLGYGLWIVLISAAVATIIRPERDLIILLACAVGILLLLLPPAGFNAFLWANLPQAVVRITYYWPMQRFYVILASIVAVVGQGSFSRLVDRRYVGHGIWALLLGVCCSWGLWESRQFIRAAGDRTASIEVSETSQRPENLFLTNDSYGLFDKLPPDFSNGVVDPKGQARLISVDSGRAAPQPAMRLLESSPFTATVDSNPGILKLEPSLHLEPGKPYALEFGFASQRLTGILQLTGKSMFREYKLPSSGESLAFGCIPPNTNRIALWTSNPNGDEIHVRFIPSDTAAINRDLDGISSYRLFEVDPSHDPVEVVALTPFKALVRSPDPAILETPRMSIRGYRASVDGQAFNVGMSASGLATVRVPPGEHAVSLWFEGPVLLRISYWCALAAWAVTAVLAAGFSIRTLQSPKY